MTACANLPAPGVCGNGVHEAELGEDCDGGENCAGCRLRCDGDLPCPDGGACGVDGLCSFPSGQLAYPATFVDYAPSYVRVIDQDKDGIGDVVGVSPFSIDLRFGSSTADLGRADGILTPFLTNGDPRPVLGEIHGLGMAAILPTPDGITAYFTDGNLLLPLPTPAIPGSDIAQHRDATIACTPFECGLTGIFSGSGGTVYLFVSFGDSVVAIDTPCGATDVTAITPAVALRSPSGYDRVAVAAGGQVCVYSLDGEPAGGATITSPPSRLIPVQIDGDGCDEVAVATEEGYDVVDPGGCGFAGLGPSGTDTLLAAGDLDDDLRSDFVFDDHVGFTSGGQFPIDPSHAASVGDFNRDGRSDVAVVDTAGYLGVWIGVADRELSWRPTALASKVDAIAAVDIDGDLFADVVATSRDDNRLFVLYGSPFGLDVPVTFGSASRVDTLAASARNLDGQHVADVVIVHHGNQRGIGDGTDVVRYRAVGRSLAPSTPMPFGATQGVLFDSLVPVPPGVTEHESDVAAFGFDGEGGLMGFWLPGPYVANGVEVAPEPFVRSVDNSSGYFQTPAAEVRDAYAPALESLIIGGAPAVLAARRAPGIVDGVVFRPPTGPDQTPIAPWRLGLVPSDAPPQTCNFARQLWRMRPVQFDSDADTELAVITIDSSCWLDGAACRDDVCESTYRAYLVDLAADGTSATATELGLDVSLAEGDYYACSDAVAIELGALGPDGDSNSGPQELVLSCVVQFAERNADGSPVRTAGVPVRGEPEPALVGFYSRDGAPVGGRLLAPTPWYGDLAAGDVTGDGLDDVILMFFGIAGVAVQCPRHDAGACEL